MTPPGHSPDARADRDREDLELLDAVLRPLAASLQQVNLPLHILLDSRFGDLNDNQLEMIEAARAAADDADQLLRRVRRIRELALEPPPVTTADHRPLDLLRAPVALAAAHGEARGIRVELDASPALRRVRGDRAHLEEALSAVLNDRVQHAARDAVVRVRAFDGADGTVVEIHHGVESLQRSLDTLLARRMLAREGGTLEEENGVTKVGLATASAGAPETERA